MAPAKTKKEKVFHPSSRKASQLARKSLRKSKLGDLGVKRNQKHHTLADIYGFFFHALPEEGVLTLDELHALIRNIWLTRHDQALEEERAARRKGRPKSTKEAKLEDNKNIEMELYRTGMEVIDMTHEINVQLFRQWDQKEVAYVQQLRHLRISSQQAELATVSRTGRHQLLVEMEGMEVDKIE